MTSTVQNLDYGTRFSHWHNAKFEANLKLIQSTFIESNQCTKVLNWTELKNFIQKDEITNQRN